MIPLTQEQKFKFRLRAEKEASQSVQSLQPNPQSIADRSSEFGSVTKTPTMLERVGKNLTQQSTRPLGLLGGVGVAMSAAGVPEEEAFPIIGQGVGGMASGFTGVGLLGATGGATVGQGLRQLSKKSRGEKTDLSALPKEAALTGAIEGLTRGVGGAFFRRQIANKELSNLGKQLGKMKEAMANNPNLTAQSKPILDTLENAYSYLPDPLKSGKVSAKISKWIKHLKQNPNMHAKDLILMEEDLGQAATYGQFKKGVFQPATDIPNKAMNTIAKTGRTQTSGIVDDLAELGGQKGFKKTSMKISKLRDRYPDIDPTKSYGSFGGRVGTAIAATTLTGNPLAGVGAYAAEKVLQNPSLRNSLFSLFNKPVLKSIGKTAKLGTTETLRRLQGA